MGEASRQLIVSTCDNAVDAILQNTSAAFVQALNLTISVGVLRKIVHKHRDYTDRCLSGVKKGEQTGVRRRRLNPVRANRRSE